MHPLDPRVSMRTSSFPAAARTFVRTHRSAGAHRHRQARSFTHSTGIQPRVASRLAGARDVRGRDDHQRPERVAIAAVQSFVRITGTPETGQHPGSPTAGDLRTSPATAALAGSHSSPLGVRITPWPARVRPGLNTNAFGSLTPPQSGIERRSEPRRRHRDRRCGYEGRRGVALDGSRRGGRYSTRARRRWRFGSEVTH